MKNINNDIYGLDEAFESPRNQRRMARGEMPVLPCRARTKMAIASLLCPNHLIGTLMAKGATIERENIMFDQAVHSVMSRVLDDPGILFGEAPFEDDIFAGFDESDKTLKFVRIVGRIRSGLRKGTNILEFQTDIEELRKLLAEKDHQHIKDEDFCDTGMKYISDARSLISDFDAQKK